MQIQKNIFQKSAVSYTQILENSVLLIIVILLLLLLPSCKKNVDQNEFDQPKEHLTGVPPFSGMLDRSKLTMTSVIQVDLDRNIARVPLFKGTFNGNTVWYVRMDVSDSILAKTLGA